MKSFSLRKISSLILSKPSKVLCEINSNALMEAWSQRNSADTVFKHRFELYEYINSSVLSYESIDYLEFGVFQGKSISKWTEINKNGSSRFYGFDSFEGLPETWDGDLESKAAKHFDVGGRIPKTDDVRLLFIKGLFQDTLPEFLASYTPRNRIVVHNDSDLYSSSLYCLTMLDSILVKGSILIFDEFYSSSHEFQAFIDYTRAYRKKYSVLASVGKNPYMQIAIMIE